MVKKSKQIRRLLRFIRAGAVGLLLLGTSGMSQRAAFLSSLPVIAQVTSDGTTGTVVNQGALTPPPPVSPFAPPSVSPGNGSIITSGQTEGTNLFHSFSTFSPGTDLTEFRLSDPSIRNIFSRVTGPSTDALPNTSDLNGFLQVIGGDRPNLFLLNPNGILIGPTANINVPGSLFLSTADRVLFEDSDRPFSASDTTNSPLLTVSAPVGLQFGDRAASIDVNGRFQSSFSPNRNNPAEFYNFVPNTNLTLLGGDLNLTDAYLNVPGGQITLSSVGANSRVNFDATTHDLTYTVDTAFRDIKLDHSVAVTTFTGGGDINVQGRQIRLLNGGGFASDTFGAENGGTIRLSSSELIEIKGQSGLSAIVAPFFGPATGEGSNIIIETERLVADEASISTITYSDGDGGDLTLRADEIDLKDTSLIVSVAPFQASRTTPPTAASGDGGRLDIRADELRLSGVTQIGTGTKSAGNSGDLTVDATSLVEISGSQLFDFSAQGGPTGTASSGIFISSERGSTGNGGNLRVTTSQLILKEGGKLGAGTSGTGNAGNITVRADDISISDPVVDFDGSFSGIVTTVTPTGVGNAGTLDITSNRLHLFNGGQVAASTDGVGNAGNIKIQSNEITVEGSSADGLFNSSISSRSTTPFDAGSVSLTGDRINITDNGTVSVSSLSGGSAGNVTLAANQVYLDNGSVQAEANAGDQGNLSITSRGVLLMRGGSQLTTNAQGTATGGNITLDSPLIIGLENSDISANAVEGDGGNIRLITQGLIGLEFRDRLTPESDITASSEFGVNGTVQIESPNVDADSGLVQLPDNLEDTSNQVVAGCAAQSDSQFASTGRGGLPGNPTAQLSGNRLWQDTRSLVSAGTAISNSAIDGDVGIELVEAQSWQMNAAGEVELMTASTLSHQANRCLDKTMASAH